MKTHFTLKKLSILPLIFASITHPVFAKSGDYLHSFKLGGENWGSVTVKDFAAYVGSDNGHLYSLNLDRNKTNWQFKTEGKVRSKPAIFNHQLFFTSDDGYLYALNRWSGTELWRVSINDDDVVRNLPANHAPWDFDYTKSSPIVFNGSVFVGSGDGQLYSINASTGSINWQFKTDGIIRSTPAVKDQQVVFGSWDGSVYAVDIKSGQLSWQFKTEGAVVSSPLVMGDKVIIGSRDTLVYALDIQSGSQVWQLALPGGSWVESSAVADENGEAFFLGSSDANLLLKVNAQSGDILWDFSTKGWSWGKPIVKDGTVYIGAVGHDEPGWYETRSGFYAVDAATGLNSWQYQPEKISGFVHGGVYGTPGIGYGKVIVPDLDGYIHVFEK